MDRSTTMTTRGFNGLCCLIAMPSMQTGSSRNSSKLMTRLSNIFASICLYRSSVVFTSLSSACLPTTGCITKQLTKLQTVIASSSSMTCAKT